MDAASWVIKGKEFTKYPPGTSGNESQWFFFSIQLFLAFCPFCLCCISVHGIHATGLCQHPLKEKKKSTKQLSDVGSHPELWIAAAEESGNGNVGIEMITNLNVLGFEV